ncbi:BMP family protein [Jannaschia rubra]|uniref:BMP family protein n=1 Tax=Jannaschia rubra TaxID=282197 RepID=UPI002491AA48|nr:BMP family protein [Jannaschia rubra]
MQSDEPITRRTAFLATAALAMTMGSAAVAQGNDALSVAMLIPGQIDDNGFMEAGYDGLMAIERELGATTAYIDGVKPKPELLMEALRTLAAEGPDLVIAHGGQNNEAAQTVAPEFPAVKFVVVQGDVTGANLSSYDILQEESAWLAGAAAGLMTETDVVGHISGIRVTPGLKGRGGFYNGLMHTNPEATFLTIFAGDQDDNDLSYRVANEEIDGGADIIFTMLNAGRTGAIDAMREKGVRQIGNVGDWTQEEPEVFVASAIADVSQAGLMAARDVAEGGWKPDTIVRIGLSNPEAVSLSLAPDVPDDVRAEVDRLRDEIVAGNIEVSTDYEGAELTP